MTSQHLAVYGSGGFAREVAWLAQECGYDVVCFIEDDAAKTSGFVDDLPVMSVHDAAARYRNHPIAAGIGSPSAREAVIRRAISHDFIPALLVHPRVEKSQRVTLGKGVVICAGNILTTNITVGDYVQINLDCTIGHDVELADYATLAPGVHVSGCVSIGRRAYIGTGATIINGTPQRRIVIGDDAVVGAGACVTRSVDAGVTVVGVPAKPITQR